MKATELRIGNLYEYFIIDPMDERKEWWEVSRIDVDDLKWLSVADDDSNYKSIPLTEEWLLKFGFELFPWGWAHNGILIRWNINKKEFWIELGNGKRVELPYVHTLQNFFYLAGEELTIK